MAYSLLASEETVHVLSPTLVIDAVRATLVTPTHNVIASSVVPQVNWGTAAGADQLNQLSFGIEWLLDHTPAFAAVGGQTIDANGLLQHTVTFTVGYTPPGATTGPLTVRVDVPATLLEQIIAPNGPHPGLDEAHAMIDAAEQSLVAMAGG